MQQMIFVADFIACSTCFGQYYAHHQELESIIQIVERCICCCRVCRVEHAIKSAINIIFASSWRFISTYVDSSFNPLKTKIWTYTQRRTHKPLDCQCVNTGSSCKKLLRLPLYSEGILFYSNLIIRQIFRPFDRATNRRTELYIQIC